MSCGRFDFTVAAILDQLDAEASRFCFPVLDNGYVYPADVRMQSFRDAARWAIVIEDLGFNPRDGCPAGIRAVTSVFGNCIQGEPGFGNEDFHSPVEDGPSAPLGAEDDQELVNEQARDILIRGETVPITLDVAYYKRRKIRLEHRPRVAIFELLRGLLPVHREGLLPSATETRARIPDDLPSFLALDEWRHPDVAGGELPSATLTFRRLAQALVDGDPAGYAPPSRPNTHWRHWPEGGTL